MCNLKSKVFVLIPAHNEEKDIEKTLMSVLSQTYLANTVVVALDNCTDNTEAIVRACGVDSFKTVGNTARKAGALNQGMGYILEKYGEPDFLLQMDADTFLDSKLIEEGIKELQADTKIGGVCNRFRVRPYEGGNIFLYTLQYLDYSLFDSTRVERRMNTHVLSGTATLFRMEALNSLESLWDEDSFVEDYRMSLDLKRIGWKLKVGKNMYTLTDYMTTLKTLWSQRKRWYYGTIEESLIEGWQKHNRSDIVNLIYNYIIGGLNAFFFVLLITLLALGMVAEWHILGKIIIVVALIDRLYRGKYVKEKTELNMLLHLSLIPSFLYGMFIVTCYYYSTYLVFTNKSLSKW